VLLERRDGIATVTLNRPEVLNALNTETWTALHEVATELTADDETAAVVLTGTGRAFCAGNDINMVQRRRAPETPDGFSQATAAADSQLQIETSHLLEELPQPLIAAVNGYCFTAGLEIILVCDIVLAAESAKIGDTHAKWGLVPTLGGPLRLSRRVGLSQAKEMIFTCRQYSAAQCEAMGLVDHTVPDAELMPEALSLAREIAGHSRESIVKQKRMMTAGWHHGLADSLRVIEQFHPGVAADSAARLATFKRS